MASTPRFDVRTTQYQFSHGKAPRGYGRWIFDITIRRASGVTTDRFARTGTYASSVGQCKKALRQRDGILSATIEVGS